MSLPGPLPERGIGAACDPGVPVEVHPLVTRVTAPNPSMMTGPGTNAYVVGDDGLVVVDPGPLIESHVSLLVDVVASRPVRAVAVTHHHRDHAPAAGELASRLGAPVVGFGHALLDVDEEAREGDELTAGTLGLVAWHTPGHASDHLCFAAPSIGWLFTGDHLMQGSTVVIRPPDGDMAAYLRSLARVRDDAGLRRLAPGHGRIIEHPKLAAEEVIAHRTARAGVVLRALRSHGPASAAGLRPVAYADVGADRAEIATASCWAHLLALVDDGLATTTAAREDPGAVFTAASASAR